ncbi:DNA-binding LacI/PurR family transcriptional regulator [Gracilibacillus halotolerans]|uniref:DNA-binding LacI/PurR family transcriptional regulator n=1 Tax=Gracilibacillus halotolerans TaxID=74386 RepID=A0A841RQ13_9BACI|nr:LacI family DNA-binding transcriptional regulator [Gracilibacillus halotolerans]MBB6512738.1 DNA-binding LacI/PurR family transcriptional regulator [Gracilibacillus halotolerans]
MSITIKDVAKRAGVAPSTVSRVIADNPRISMETKKRVRKAMKDLGYHPNINARNLAVRSSQSIGVIMPSSADVALQNPFFPEVLRGIGSHLHEVEYSLYVSTGGNEETTFEEVQRMVNGNRVDGIILLYSRMNDPVQEFLMEKKFPFVIVGKPFENESEITYVDNNNVQASKDLTNHLIELGHQHIAFIGGSKELTVTSDRLHGYRSAIKEASLPLPDEYIIHTAFLKSGGREAVEKLFQLDTPPTGLVVADDLMTLGVMNALEELGINCPEDVSITSFNNLYLSEITTPALTTVDIQIYNLGVQSARCLLELTKNKDEPAKRIIIPYDIKYRKSTTPIN